MSAAAEKMMRELTSRSLPTPDYPTDWRYTVRENKSNRIIISLVSHSTALSYQKTQRALFKIECTITENEGKFNPPRNNPKELPTPDKQIFEPCFHEYQSETDKDLRSIAANAVHSYADWKKAAAHTKMLRQMARLNTKHAENTIVGHIDEVVETEYLMREGFSVIEDFCGKHIVFQGTEYACTQYLIERASYRGFDMADFSIEPFEGRK